VYNGLLGSQDKLGKNIKNKRKTGLTQAEIAETINILQVYFERKFSFYLQQQPHFQDLHSQGRSF